MQSSPAVFVSTGAFQERQMHAVLEESARIGIRNIELSSGIAPAPNLLDTVCESQTEGFNFLVHNHFPPQEEAIVINLATADPANRSAVLSHCKQSLDLCAQLGAPFFSVHAGFGVELAPEDLGRPLTSLPRLDAQESFLRFASAAEELAEYGADKGVQVLVENHVVHGFNADDGFEDLLFCSTPDQIDHFFSAATHPNLGILVDLGHLKVTARSLHFEIEQFLSSVGDRLEAFHLSDNDGCFDSNEPFDETVWFLPLIDGFPAAIRIVEAYNLSSLALERCVRALSS
jgi:sugar phosphate isomerase/epimerase